MKIKIFTNKVKAKIDDDFIKFKDYFKSQLNLDIELEIQETTVEKQDAPLKLFLPNDGKCDIVMYIYDRYSTGESKSFAWNHSTTLQVVTLSTSVVDDNVNFTWVQMVHETLHCLFNKLKLKGVQIVDPMDISFNGNIPYFLNDQPFNKDSAYVEAIKRLTPYYKPGYKYFKENEVRGLKPEFVQLLDKARGIAGVPFRITSGYRSPSHNEAVGGVEGSSHTTGLAVDLAVADGVTGGKILLALVQVGFKRFGFYQDGHIHVDLDNSKPNPCYWVK